jgi:hypothetical protein
LAGVVLLEPDRSLPRREPELIDYIRVAWRWKWLIVGGTALTVALAIWSPLRPAQKFAASVTYDIGLPTDHELPQVERFIALFRRTHSEDVVLQSPIPGVLRLDVMGNSDEEARRGAAAASLLVESELSKITGEQHQRTEADRREREQLSTYVSELRRVQVQGLREMTSANALLLLTAISNDLQRLDERLGVLEKRSGGSDADTVHVGVLNVRPAPGSSRRLVGSVAFLSGLIGFTGLAFLVDYVLTARSIAPATTAVPSSPRG